MVVAVAEAFGRKNWLASNKLSVDLLGTTTHESAACNIYDTSAVPVNADSLDAGLLGVCAECCSGLPGYVRVCQDTQGGHKKNSPSCLTTPVLWTNLACI